MAGTILAIAVNSLPAVAGEDAEGADCFFAENRDDPLCGRSILTAAGPQGRATSPDDEKRDASRDDDGSVDCFFAENRSQPFCSETVVQ
jgi:hypothetical protein